MWIDLPVITPGSTAASPPFADTYCPSNGHLLTPTQQKKIGTLQVFCGAVCGEIMNLTKASRYSIILCYCISTLDAIYSKLNMAAAHTCSLNTHTHYEKGGNLALFQPN